MTGKFCFYYPGAPVPRAQWSKNGELLNEANLDTETVPTLTTLRVPGAQRIDTGLYELTLSNEAGSDKETVKIVVLGMLTDRLELLCCNTVVILL